MAVTKEDILAAIQRAATARGGRIGLAAFLEETGIPEKQILGKHRATWNEALSEAGVKTTSFKKPRTPEDTVLETVAQFVVRLGKWPTENRLSLERRRNRARAVKNLLRYGASGVSYLSSTLATTLSIVRPFRASCT
ncbi:MAG TPA: hypothetical protein VMV25_08915 [Steroidobacteraceae bacterium]|nr:hypothetical protein [Steroidobacteraceae bacterium]